MNRIVKWAGAFGLVVALGIGAVGCSCREGGQAAKDLNLDYSPRTIDFGTVAILQEAWVTVTLTHVGFSGTIEFGEISIDANTTEFTFDAPEKMALEPGESTTITVRYNPADSVDDSGELVIKHNVAQQGNETRIPIVAGGFFADLVSIPSPIDFEQVQQGQIKDLDVILKNIGSDQVVITQVTLDSAGSDDFGILALVLADGQTLPITLKPDESLGLVMRYTPRTDEGNPAQDQSVLIVEGQSKGLDQSWTFDVYGGELGPRLVVTPGQVDFQWVGLNQTKDRWLTLENVGNDNLVIEDLYLVVGSNADIALPDKPTAAVTLKPGETREQHVTWTPTEAFPESADPIGTLAILSNDVSSPTTVQVYGRVDSPLINVVPASMDFGFGAQNLAVERTLTIRNDGHGVLKISGFEVVDQVPTQYGQEFSFEVPAGAVKNAYGEYEIQGNASLALKMAFTNKGPGSGSASARLKITSNSVGTEVVHVPLSAQRAISPECKLALNPPSLSFGTVPAGFTKELAINLINTGSGDCWFKSARIEDCTGFGGMFSQCAEPGAVLASTLFTFLSMPVPNSVIKPGAAIPLRVRFAPKTANSIFGELNTFSALLSVIGYDPVAKKETRIPAGQAGGTGTLYNPNITGATGIAKVSVLPATIDFGLVTIGCYSQTTRVCVYNTGSAALSITEIKMAGCSPEFRLKKVPGLPKDITSAGPICFETVYAPQDEGKDECVIQVASNDQSAPSMSVAVKGEGTYETEQTDIFEQVSGQAVDILFVIDDSGSMCEEQDRLIENFQSFISQAEIWNNDYHIGIISVNVVNEAVMGKLNRGASNLTPRYITKGPNAQAQFAKLADIGCDGNSDAQEAAMQAAQAALSTPLTSETGVSCSSDSECRSNKNLCSSSTNCPYYCVEGTCGGWNKGFMRKDAQLEIVALSDEEDQSSGTPDFYVDFFKSIKGYYNTNMMHFNAIVGIDDPNDAYDGYCMSPDESTGAADGKRYIDVAQRTNGQVGSICDPDYDVIMNQIGSVAFGLKVQFYLSRLADPPTVEVRVNDALCSTGWRYDAPSNSVIFEESGSCMPQPGDIIKIHYDTLCLKG